MKIRTSEYSDVRYYFIDRKLTKAIPHLVSQIGYGFYYMLMKLLY